MNLILKITFWFLGTLLGIASIIGIYLLAFYYGFFGVLEKADPNINSTYPKNLLTQKIQSQLEHNPSNKQILLEHLTDSTGPQEAHHQIRPRTPSSNVTSAFEFNSGPLSIDRIEAKTKRNKTNETKRI